MKKFLVLLIILLQFGVVFASGEETMQNSGDIIDGQIDNIDESITDYETLPSDIPKQNGKKQNKYKSESVTFKCKVVTAGEKYEEKVAYATDAVSYQDVRVKIDEDGYSDIILVKYELSYYSNPKLPQDELEVGDIVYVTVVFDEDGNITYSYIEYISNERFLIAMVILYAGAIILIGGFKGLRALIGLIITILAMFFILVPLIFAGYSPLLVTICTCAVVILITFIIVSGFSKKTIAATIGTIGGILVAGIFATIFGNLMKLTGVCEHANNLSMAENVPNFNFEDIMISGIIIGALGACMDVGMSIASSIHELSVEGYGMTKKQLIRSGMNIGKDVMGTMTNTLILAYVGSSLLIILLLRGYNFEPYQIFNNVELVVEEVLRAIAGSFGLVFTIPITTLVSSALMGNGNNSQKLIEDKKFIKY